MCEESEEHYFQFVYVTYDMYTFLLSNITQYKKKIFLEIPEIRFRYEMSVHGRSFRHKNDMSKLYISNPASIGVDLNLP